MNTSPITATVESVNISLDRIPTDEKAQTRVSVRANVVRDYAAAMTAQLAEGGVSFPPVILFTDGIQYWLGDGFHRVLAARKAGLTEIAAELRQGTQRDAVLCGISANCGHGLQRNSADKRHAVQLMLADPEWSQWSDREIARRCQAGDKLVRKMRRASAAGPQMRARKVRRGKNIYAMDIDYLSTPTKEPASSVLPESATLRTPAPPTTDALGLPLPSWSVPVFASITDFRRARELFDRLAEVIDRISQSPAGEMYRQELVRTDVSGRLGFACPALRTAQNKLVAQEPYCGCCPSCYAVQPGRANPRCKKCGGRGWTTRTVFESCAEGDRQRVLKMGAEKA